MGQVDPPSTCNLNSLESHHHKMEYSCSAKVLEMTSSFIMELCHGPGVYLNQILCNSIGVSGVRFFEFLLDHMRCYGILGASFRLLAILIDAQIFNFYSIFKATAFLDDLLPT